MDKASEYINKSGESNGALPLATDIGREFVRQYYTKWTFQLSEVFQFYGNESIFLHDDNEAKGQEAIQKLIEKLSYKNCKARIHSVIGVYGANDSLVLQVCGELAIDQGSSRRFLQHFVLCKQQAKKYYVQNDIFQWLDKSFCEVSSQNDIKVHANVKDNNKELSIEKTMDHTTTTTQQNGHSVGQKPVSALDDLNSLTKIISGDNENVSTNERISSTAAELSATLTNNGSSNFSSPNKGATPQQTSKNSTQLLQQQLTSPSTQQTTTAPLSDGVQQQQPATKHLSQQQQRTYNSSQQRHSQRPSYGQQQHNSHHPSSHGTAPPSQQQQQQQQQRFYRHQSQAQTPPQQQQQPQHQQLKRQDSHPKTWAKAVSNNSSSTGLTNQTSGNPNNYANTNNVVGGNNTGNNNNTGFASGGNTNTGYNGSGSHNTGYNNGGNNYSGNRNHHHSKNQLQHHSQQQQSHQQFRSSFGGGGGNGGNYQRKQFPSKTQK